MSKGVVLATGFIVLMCLCLTVAKKRYRTLLYAISAFYLLSVLYFTFLRGERADLASISIKPPFYILKAITTGKYRAVTNRSVLNLLLFVPFGYLLPQWLELSDKTIRWWKIMLAGFFTSLLIEVGQLMLRRGAFELDDLVKNTMGAVVGWMVWRTLDKTLRNRTKDTGC